MKSPTIVIRPEIPDDADEIELLNQIAFGPGRVTRTAYRLREGIEADPKLCFVAALDPAGNGAQLVGSVRQTPIAIGDRPALLLGPLVVAPCHKGLGIGRELMLRSLAAATDSGDGLVLLVGDLSYYSRFGFRIVPHGQVRMPGPVDSHRLLALELGRADLDDYRGQAARMRQSHNTG